MNASVVFRYLLVWALKVLGIHNQTILKLLGKLRPGYIWLYKQLKRPKRNQNYAKLSTPTPGTYNLSTLRSVCCYEIKESELATSRNHDQGACMAVSSCWCSEHLWRSHYKCTTDQCCSNKLSCNQMMESRMLWGFSVYCGCKMNWEAAPWVALCNYSSIPK